MPVTVDLEAMRTSWTGPEWEKGVAEQLLTEAIAATLSPAAPALAEAHTAGSGPAGASTAGRRRGWPGDTGQRARPLPGRHR